MGDGYSSCHAASRRSFAVADGDEHLPVVAGAIGAGAATTAAGLAAVGAGYTHILTSAGARAAAMVALAKFVFAMSVAPTDTAPVVPTSIVIAKDSARAFSECFTMRSPSAPDCGLNFTVRMLSASGQDYIAWLIADSCSGELFGHPPP
jgi:hypothetical protein